MMQVQALMSDVRRGPYYGEWMRLCVEDVLGEGQEVRVVGEQKPQVSARQRPVSLSYILLHVQAMSGGDVRQWSSGFAAREGLERFN